jgi:hypothetical protein
LAVSLAVVAVVALRACQQAIDALDTAVSSQLIIHSKAVGNTDPALSRLLSIAAWRIKRSSAAYHAMLTAAELSGIPNLGGPPRSGHLGGPIAGQICSFCATHIAMTNCVRVAPIDRCLCSFNETLHLTGDGDRR